MKRPVILLTCSGLRAAGLPPGGLLGPCRGDSTPGHRGCQKEQYVLAVEKAGGSPLLLPNSRHADAARSAVAAADGLLLTGGCDVSPSLYARRRHPTVKNVDPVRDRTERVAIAAAMESGKPILAICRGLQILNVALGGTLIQDISSGVDAALAHGDCEHSISVERSSLLARLLRRRNVTVNSTHHQAVEQPAAALRAVAWADDGVVEALEPIDDYPLLAVQSHPERLIQRREMLALFRWLIAAAGKPLEPRARRGLRPPHGGQDLCSHTSEWPIDARDRLPQLP